MDKSACFVNHSNDEELARRNSIVSTEIDFHHQNSTFLALKFISSIEIYKVTVQMAMNTNLN